MIDLQPLLNPRSIVVIGASRDDTKMGSRCLGHLLKHGYPGKVWPVHRTSESIQGLPTVASVADLPEAAELAIVSVPAATVPQTLTDCAERGVRAALVLSSGFAETGAEGKELQRQVVAIAARTGLLVAGPNSNGFMSSRGPVVATSNPALAERPRPGGIALVSQTGGIGLASVQYLAARRGIGLRYNVSTGNEACLCTSDYVEYLSSDVDTRVIAVIVEGFADGERFLTAVRAAAAAGKPVVLLKLGRSERGGALTLSHTGMLAGSHEVQRSVLAEAGVTEVSSIDELLDVVALFDRVGPRLGNGVGIVSPSGGAAVHASDLCEEAGLVVTEVNEATRARLREILPDYASASNPVDLTATGTGDASMYTASIRALADDPGVHIVLCVLTVAINFDKQLAALRDSVADLPKPLIFAGVGGAVEGAGFATLTDAGYVVYPTIQGACAAMRAASSGPAVGPVRASLFAQSNPARAIAERPGADLVRDWASGSQDEHRSKNLLRAYGIACLQEVVAATPAEAAEAAAALGYPVAVKALADGLVHKTDIGGVRLGLTDGPEVRAAAEQIAESVGRAGFGNVSFLVSPMVSPVAELIVGLRRDEQFGQMLMVGTGGTYVEILRDVRLRRVPVDLDVARAMLKELRIAPVLHGARSGRVADIDAVANIMVALSQLALDWRDELDEFDLNPVAVQAVGDGAVVLDATAVWRGNGAR